MISPCRTEKVVIDVILENGEVARGVADLDKQLGGIGDTGKKAAIGVGKIATALGLVYVAKKGIDLVRDSLDGAIDRYDTLNQFPRVMQMIGFDAEESENAITKLSDGIDGLPTTLDSVASTAQNIAVLTGDLDGAVDTTLALNNAFLASGASTADAERGLQQYVQMLSKGEVDLQSWRTLQETMGVALRTVADDFGFTGKAATNDLYDALKSGEITMDEFNTKLIEASEAQGGFADMAGEASAGIKTSWQNMKTSVVKGLADVIGAIDKALGGTGEIEGIIDKMKAAFQAAFAWIVSAIPAVAESIRSVAESAKEVWQSLQPWIPLIVAIGAGVATFVAMASAFTIMSAVVAKAVGIFNMVRTAILAVRVAMITLNAAILANPIALVVAAIVAAAVLIYVYWEPISEFFLMIWGVIKDAGLEIWENLKEGWANAVQVLTETWQSVSEFFTELWENIKQGALFLWDVVVAAWDFYIETIKNNWNTIVEFFSNLWQSIIDIFVDAVNWLNEVTNGGFAEYVAIVQAQLMAAWEVVQSIWTYIKETFSNFLKFIKALVTLDFQGMKDAMKDQMETSKNLLKNIWQAIKSNIGAKLAEILSSVIDKFNQVKSNIKNKITEAKAALVQKFVEMVTNTAQKAAQIVTTARDKFNEVKQAIKDKLTEAVTTVSDKVGEMPGKVIDKVSDMISAGKDLISGLIKGITNMGKDAIEAVTGVVDGVIGKAKSLLKIESPSKVFTEFGGFVSQGLANGITKMKKLAERASSGLAMGISDSFDPTLEVSGVKGLDRIKGISANSVIGNLSGTNSTASVNESVTENKYNTVDMEGLFNGAVFNVRDDDDIPRLAKELNDYIKKGARKNGVRMP